jgi:hypothetical protein
VFQLDYVPALTGDQLALGSTLYINIEKRAACDEQLATGAGACCNTSNCTCKDVASAAACTGGGTFTAGKVCTTDFCPASAKGPCCDGLNGTCTNCVAAADCKPSTISVPTSCEAQCDAGDAGTTCADLVPLCSAADGACCNHDAGPLATNGTCTITSRFDCLDGCTTCEWTKGEACADIECTADFIAIPTVSEWGLVILTLLLLTGAKVYFGRRRVATA